MIDASPAKLLIAVALSAEARPLIRHFELKKNATFERMEVFSNEEIYLIVTGAGKIQSAAAVSAFLAVVDDIEGLTAFNIGIAAATATAAETIGTPLLVHKIIDDASGRELFPDVLVSTGLAETVLTTVDRFAADPADDRFTAGVVDMEGSGFFQAAAMFLAPHRIVCIKIISDRMHPASVSRADVSRLLEAAAPSLDRVYAAYKAAFAGTGQLAPQPSDIAWLKHTSEILRLTVTQHRQLTRWVAAFRAHSEGALPEVSPESCASKQERSRRLEALKHALMA